ncbi:MULTISPECIES: preprotein translocase subunit YajC [Roseivirga]|jgi:preprotein translocase subunit YajC|uniref:Sec translocon accessory complex subunit YajC n=1 Tax=Roseivirga spongicola TaxID=333140 RepID=A0A150XEX4_9BACT|nr:MULTISPECIES: preprotein translocase subunit YajC [Roseivirga]PWL30272.1 MAG: preprotein translocase subunit YajC [Roseivirga sp. XM-24bin3]KYG77285.1 preprotein translocase subunit YajC [Roseivirga spongicola]MBO6497266.1 preprotein translocase subunit YajC [Roseivirga sp.]MBO6662628.1 preprotein translocase subunit YajC [Roseivirga sp.]MBO6760850.1 preprotein translocase subunit YajC [Roseivirga sp.]|tara:strand:+ start:334 stop:654 length:321 start_codon:yes stop_codon:yes gene_type:complete
MIYSILVQSQTPQGGGWVQQLVLFGGIALVFYFFMIRPQQKKQKDQKNFINEIKKGDSVVTIGGMHGKVFALTDDTVTVEVDKGVKLTFEKSSISLEASKRANEKA